jgi:prophage regulatory protein
MSDRFMRAEEVAGLMGISKPTLIRWADKGVFPKPVKIGPRAVGWRESVVDAYMVSREEAATAALA